MKKYSNNRSGRIADQIHKDVVDILRHKIKDVRVKWVTINDVEVDDDFAWAKIYWSVMDETKIDEINLILLKATGFVRRELSKGFKTYTIPQIKFIHDISLMRGSKILEILENVIHKDDKK